MKTEQIILPNLYAGQELLCGESPVWDPVHQILYWTDALGAAIYFKSTEQDHYSVLHSGHQVSALALHNNGGLVLAGKTGLAVWEKGSIRALTSRAGDIEVNNLNEVIVDPSGRVFTGQESFTEEGPYEPGYLFRIDPDGSVHVVEEGIHLSNGMGFSPDEKTFYLTDTIMRTIYAYDYSVESGQLSNRRKLIELKQEEGLPDGLSVDLQGNIWVAHWFGGKVSCFNPDGDHLNSFFLPAAQVSSLTFGGTGMDDLFVTTAGLQWESPLAPPDHNFSSPRGGSLYLFKGIACGKQEYLARI